MIFMIPCNLKKYMHKNFFVLKSEISSFLIRWTKKILQLNFEYTNLVYLPHDSLLENFLEIIRSWENHETKNDENLDTSSFSYATW